MDKVRRIREPIPVTKKGKPASKRVPVNTAKNDSIGRLEGVIRITGDIESPVVPPEDWDALQ